MIVFTKNVPSKPMEKIFLSTNEMLSSINAAHGLRKSLEIVIGAKSKKADHVQ